MAAMFTAVVVACLGIAQQSEAEKDSTDRCNRLITTLAYGGSWDHDHHDGDWKSKSHKARYIRLLENLEKLVFYGEGSGQSAELKRVEAVKYIDNVLLRKLNNDAVNNGGGFGGLFSNRYWVQGEVAMRIKTSLGDIRECLLEL